MKEEEKKGCSVRECRGNGRQAKVKRFARNSRERVDAGQNKPTFALDREDGLQTSKQNPRHKALFTRGLFCYLFLTCSLYLQFGGMEGVEMTPDSRTTMLT